MEKKHSFFDGSEGLKSLPRSVSGGVPFTILYIYKLQIYLFRISCNVIIVTLDLYSQEFLCKKIADS